MAQGPIKLKKRDFFNFALLLIGIISLAAVLLFQFDYQWNWKSLWPYLLSLSPKLQIGIIFQGFFQTILISLISIIIAFVLGFILSLSSLSHWLPLRWLSKGLIEVVRGTPLLVQLFIVYFMLGTVLKIDSGFICAIWALSLFAACYVSEILRSGIQAIPRGQWDAAHVLGLNKNQALFYIVIPQALKISLPALAGTFISLIKDSSLVSVLAIMDLTKAGREVISNTFSVFETWIIVAFLYLLLTYPLSVMARKMEKNLDQNS